ncbi:MAG TPA: zinc-binding alcohol dehydrogenase family protein [Gemmataceae bacterium]|nr:zinc-binding alcohol dehydrogenase family protein [Gemmataceae bacterium]
MKAIRLEKPFEFCEVEVPEPGSPGPGEALVRVHRVGVCGTDFSGYQGKMPFFSYPRIPGHELGVEVLEVGTGVANVCPGDRCAVEPYMNCQSCYACERGHTNCCEHLQTLGVHCDGGLRSRFIVPARNLHGSQQLSFEQLALVETLGIGCHAVNRAGVKSGEHVLVIGAGPIGLSVIEFAKIAGAHTIVMDLSERRLDFVRRAMGIRDTILVRDDGQALATVTELTNGQLAHAVIDATGSNRSMGEALQYVGFAGRLVLVGISMEPIRFTQPLMHRREMTFFASRNALPGDFRRIIGLIEQGQLDTRPWITHREAFGAMIDVFREWLKPETGVIKAMVEI